MRWRRRQFSCLLLTTTYTALDTTLNNTELLDRATQPGRGVSHIPSPPWLSLHTNHDTTTLTPPRSGET